MQFLNLNGIIKVVNYTLNLVKIVSDDVSICFFSTPATLMRKAFNLLLLLLLLLFFSKNVQLCRLPKNFVISTSRENEKVKERNITKGLLVKNAFLFMERRHCNLAKKNFSLYSN